MSNHNKSALNPNLSFRFLNVPNEQITNRTTDYLISSLNLISEVIDISSLLDVRVGYGDEAYKQAIAEIDPNRKPSSGAVIGVAMALDKVTNGKYANHIVLHQRSIYGFIIDDPSEDDIGFSLQTLAHECAHVYSNMQFYEAFGFSFEPSGINPYPHITKSVASATWSEYSACSLSANMGSDPTQGFLDVLCGRLEAANHDLDNLLKQKPSNIELLSGVSQILGNIVKYAGYVIGCRHSFGLHLENDQNNDLLQYQWFTPYLYRLETVLLDIANKFEDKSVTESDLLQISDIFIDVAEHQGFLIGNDPDKGAFIFTNR